jgi:hypothetical protein
MTLQYKELKKCEFDQKFDYFHFFKNTLKSGTIEKVILNTILHDYPINDYENELFLVPRIESVIDKIYDKLKSE